MDATVSSSLVALAIAVGVAVTVAWALALCWWDWTKKRLPNYLTLPAAGLAVAGAIAWEPIALIGLVWPVMYIVLAVIQGGIGGGDIKLAIPLGIALAWAGGVISVFISMLSAALITTLMAVVVRRNHLAHGPSMFVGSLIGAAASVFL